MKKYILLSITIILLAGGSYFAEKSFLASTISTPPVFETAINSSHEVTPPEVEVNVLHTQIETPSNAEVPTPTATPEPTPNVRLVIEGHSYPIFAPPSSSVLYVMKKVAATTDFTFDGRDYPSLGFFVDSIHGKKADRGHSWILYVNGTLSGTGASQTTLKAGDAVEWRYEKNY